MSKINNPNRYDPVMTLCFLAKDLAPATIRVVTLDVSNATCPCCPCLGGGCCSYGLFILSVVFLCAFPWFRTMPLAGSVCFDVTGNFLFLIGFVLHSSRERERTTEGGRSTFAVRST
mmetsp:Transcript_9884/g.13805  ORF Transcript_9884/g.13805 Transcript_9884/m.13805 type:complete len:117 (+) Transcript_9884:281-631(+)